MNDESMVVAHAGGTTFVGPDGVSLYNAIAMASALRLYARSGMLPNRAWTATKLLQAAARITGKTYKRGQHQVASDDVREWVEAMKAAIPVVIR